MKPVVIASRLIASVALCAGLAAADEYTIDFNIAVPTSGSISYAGGPNVLIGSGISLNSVDSLNNTPNNNGALRDCLNCALNFTTGDLLSYSSGIWTFAAGGTLTITGTFDANNNGIVDGGDVTGTLLSGTFNAPVQVISLGGSSFDVVVGAFGDTINAGLSSFYGLPNSSTQPYGGGLNLSFLGGAVGAGFSSSTMLSGDVSTSVPEPLSIVLLGTVLLGCAMFAKRRFA
jgi:hypothetical protein